ncbi:hypothetical protein [Streptomyces sp. NPDC095613]|uniref:hypothetical protein n=1 Tax=Streptomyces sp. NPDC095613 TaxID=3155540 RepID=UPI00332481AF
MLELQLESESVAGAEGGRAARTADRHAPGREAGPARADDEEPCDLVTVPVRQGLEAVDILRRAAAPEVGPVLLDDLCDTVGFLVPPGTAAAWDLPGSACTRMNGRGLWVRSCWLLPPETAGKVTDPAVLRKALGEAARLIEAADGGHEGRR